VDAKTGKPIKTFGKDGQASVILDVIKERYPDVTAAIALGYWFTTAPQVHNGVIYIGSSRSESHIPGGHVLAVDAKSGKVLWHFNTIPQDGRDQGWDIAGPTWVGGERNGGGIWETPSIDPELGSSTWPSAIRSGRARSVSARTCSPIRFSRSRSARER
jgi:Glucose dehydrogenase